MIKISYLFDTTKKGIIMGITKIDIKVRNDLDKSLTDIIKEGSCMWLM